MKSLIKVESTKIWKAIAKYAKADVLDFDIELHKNLLDVFQVGDYYFYVFNIGESKLDFVSEEINAVLGYDSRYVDVPFLLDKIHPEDQSWFLNFEATVHDFFSGLTLAQIPNYKVRYDYRIRKSNGEYIRILQQVVTIEYSKEAGLLRTFGIHTDITHLKSEGKPLLSFIGLNGEPSYYNVKVKNVFAVSSPLITKREQQILKLLIEGYQSKEIAGVLHISKETVDKHRKNMLKKMKVANTAELITMAIRSGII